jgi:hypothetical protein
MLFGDIAGLVSASASDLSINTMTVFMLEVCGYVVERMAHVQVPPRADRDREKEILKITYSGVRVNLNLSTITEYK